MSSVDFLFASFHQHLNHFKWSSDIVVYVCLFCGLLFWWGEDHFRVERVKL